MLFVRRLLFAAAIAALLCATAFVAGYALKDGPSPTPSATGTGGVPTDEPSPTATADAPTADSDPDVDPDAHRDPRGLGDARGRPTTPKPTHTPKPTLEPGPALLAPGDEGDEVRDLQARLKQISWFNTDVTGTYGDVTEDRRARLPGQARDPGDRRGRPADPGPAVLR